MRTPLEKGLDEVLKEQSDAQIKAKCYDRTEERTDESHFDVFLCCVTIGF